MKRLFLSAFLLVMGAGLASGQTVTGNEFQTGQVGKTVVGTVTMCINGSSIAVPCTSAGAATTVTIDPASTLPAGTNTIGGVIQRGAASIATGQITIAATATQVVPARAGRSSVRITNLGTTDIFCGPAAVSAATGDLLAGVKGGALTVPSAAAIFCIVATGTQAVSFMETF